MSQSGERWDHASLLAGGGAAAPPPPPTLRSPLRGQPPWGPYEEESESTLSEECESPLHGWLFESRAAWLGGASAGGPAPAPTAVRHSGWLLKARGNGPAREWRRRFVYVTADRLCYTADPDAPGVRYLPLDRIPVRALPRGYGPKLGVTLVEDRQVDCSSPKFSPKKAGCVFSVACGSHTHFFAAPSAAEAKEWVSAITEAWVKCVKHTARGDHVPSADEAAAVQQARAHADSQALRRSLAQAEQARLRESTAQWQAATAAALAQPMEEPVTCYEVEVQTGSLPDAGTTASVYLELCGEAGRTSGEHRLAHAPGGAAAPFAAGATDRFRLHCAPLGRLLKVRVFHNNAGAAPAWYLEEVRARRQGPGPDGGGAWTVFPCRRWLSVHQDDGRVMRELSTGGAAEQAASLPPPHPVATHVPQPAATAQPVWYTVAVCTSAEEGAGLSAPQGTARVSLVLHGGRGSSERVQLPSQPGDFERGQEDVFRVQLPGVGSLERLALGLGGAGEQASWLVEQVEVTDGSTGETTYFPCGTWLGRAKGSGAAATECTLLGSRTNPREARREVAALRQAVEDANTQLASAQAELAAARSAAAGAEQASAGVEAELAAKLAALQAEVAALKAALAEAQQRAAAAEAAAEALRGQLRAAEQRAVGLQAEAEARGQRAAADGSRASELAAQLDRLHYALAEAQEGAAAAAVRASRFKAQARRGEEALEELRSQHERLQRDSSARAGGAEGEVARLRAEVAAKTAELREAKDAEAAADEECERLGRDLAAERAKAKERQAAADAASPPGMPASARLLASYRVCLHTSAEPPGAGTCRPVCVELRGSAGSTGPIRLDAGAFSSRGGGGACFAPGGSDTFQLEAPAVGQLHTLAVWVDMEGAAEVAPADASWHLDSAEVSAGGGAPAYFACHRWLDERYGYRAELAAASHNPWQQGAEYKVVVLTSGLAGCGTGGNVFVDIQGEAAGSGVLTLRNKGGSFRPGQADEFTFNMPSLGALCELRVGHDGKRDWHLERLEVTDTASATTFYFPCGHWVKGSGAGGAMSRALKLRGYTTDPASLPVQYRAELAVEDVAGQLGPESLRLTLFGSRGESEVQRLDATRAAAGRTLACVFQAPNVGAMERLRIGLEAEEGAGECGLLLGRLVVTDMVSGEAAAFACSEWMRSSDAYDYELDALQGGQEELPCRYRLEVQTSDVRKAGTSGSVYVTLVGDAGSIGPYQLCNTEAEHFQRGQLDVFEIDGAPDCGRLQQIEVRHDGAGRGNGWHLAWVKASNCTTGAVAMFRCNRWVDRRRTEDPGIVAVVVALPPDQAAAAGGQHSAKDRLLLGGGRAAQAASLAPVVQDVRMEAELGGSLVEAGMEGAGSEAGPPGYRVVFHTSRICGSGTKAKVFFELTGSRGSSGVLHPQGTSKSFGAGRMDIFDYPALPFLGELQSARVGTDGTGFFPAWHLALLVVTHLPTGRVWQFSCHSWVDKKSNYSRWLHLDSVEQRAVYGSPGMGAAAASAGKLGVVGGGSPLGVGGWADLQRSGPGFYHLQPARQLQYPPAGTSYPAQQRLSPAGSPAGGGPLRPKVQHSPLAAGLASASQPGSPTLGRGRQWGSSGVLRSGSGMPGSPLIGAVRR